MFPLVWQLKNYKVRRENVSTVVKPKLEEESPGILLKNVNH